MSAIKEINLLYNLYNQVKTEISKRLKEFNNTSKNKINIYKELIFCTLTPQSKAEICWKAVIRLEEKGLLLKGGKKEILKCLQGVRFQNNKAEYIKLIQKNIAPDLDRFIKVLFTYKNQKDARDYLVKNIKGLGLKEASHFLRNIGMGSNLCILDRHILKNLLKYNVIKEIPKTLTRKKYLEIEEKMLSFAKKIHIPPDHLDLLLWYKEVGKVFK